METTRHANSLAEVGEQQRLVASDRVQWICDALSLGLLFVLAVTLSWTLNHHLDEGLYDEQAADVWFQSDTPRVLRNMALPSSDHFRSKVHPLFPLIATSVVSVVRAIWPGADLPAAMHVYSLIAGLWAAALYTLCRLLRSAWYEALIFCALGLSSAAFLYWFSVPETSGWGSLSLLAALIAAARANDKPISDRAIVWTSAATLSFTVTNWMAGLALASSVRSRAAAVRLSLVAFGAVSVMALVQRAIYSSSKLFFFGSGEEMHYVNLEAAGGLPQKLSAMLLHMIVMPAHRTLSGQGAAAWNRLSIQHSIPGSGSAVGPFAVCLWFALLVVGACGLYRCWRDRQLRAVVFVVVVSFAGQITLHVIYGDETFLYALHFAPFLLTIAMFGLQTRLRRCVLLGAAALVPLCLFNNLKTFAAAEAHVVDNLTARQQVKRAMRQRPLDEWPRGQGHVVLAVPGSSLDDKAYHEPGGSFSPAPGSFGLSIWVTDAEDKLVATSDNLPLEKIHQQFGLAGDLGVPSLGTDTPLYAARWMRANDGWELQLSAKPGPPARRLWIVARSVGPAGGPIKSARLRDAQLDLDGRWRVELSASPDRSTVGIESRSGVRLKSDNTLHASDSSGWVYAALRLPPGDSWSVRVQPTDPNRNAFKPPWTRPAPYLRPQVPDAHFAGSVYAQQAHLLMGLTDLQTRPGEPLNYGFDWARDAAYIIVALARAGQTEIAASLVEKLATHDFFGGFGAEADAPGLALWALAAVADARSSADFDRTHWPAVQLKAALIEQCLRTEQVVRETPTGPLSIDVAMVPLLNRVCERARQGLIVGWMDQHHPILYVNAVSYLGLRVASRWAERVGDPARAGHYAKLAEAIAEAWSKLYRQSRSERVKAGLQDITRDVHMLFDQPFLTLKLETRVLHDWVTVTGNERTRAIGLWPSWIAAADPALEQAYTLDLANSWERMQSEPRARPAWTYFTVAEAHQSLLLGHTERVHAMLRWLHANSMSRGLYTWWEGDGEENSSHLWESVRGWVAPTGVTPHYWTAAEVLLLQLDMLAYVDERSTARPVVIGAGVPKDWLGSELSSGTIRTARGPVSWVWRSGTLTVNTERADVPIELGPAFSRATLVRNVTGS